METFFQIAKLELEKNFQNHKFLSKIVCNLTELGVEKVFVVDKKMNTSDNVNQGKIVRSTERK